MMTGRRYLPASSRQRQKHSAMFSARVQFHMVCRYRKLLLSLMIGGQAREVGSRSAQREGVLVQDHMHGMEQCEQINLQRLLGRAVSRESAADGESRGQAKKCGGGQAQGSDAMQDVVEGPLAASCGAHTASGSKGGPGASQAGTTVR